MAIKFNGVFSEEAPRSISARSPGAGGGRGGSRRPDDGDPAGSAGDASEPGEPGEHGEHGDHGASASAGSHALLARIDAAAHALQDPGADISGPLDALVPLFNVYSAALLELFDQVLYHGHSAELLGLIMAALPPPDPMGFEGAIAGHSLRELAADLLLDGYVIGYPQTVLSEERRRRPDLVAAIRQVAPLSLREIERRLAGRRDPPAEARDRMSYLASRPGAELVPCIEALTMRFGHLLREERGWSSGRAHLARCELDDLLLAGVAAPYDPDPSHVCRDCALEAPPRLDPLRDPFVAAPEPARVYAGWDAKLRRIGGPYRQAALMEALPLWVKWLRELSLVAEPTARALLAKIDRRNRELASTLVAELDDRELILAARRLRREQLDVC